MPFFTFIQPTFPLTSVETPRAGTPATVFILRYFVPQQCITPVALRPCGGRYIGPPYGLCGPPPPRAKLLVSGTLQRARCRPSIQFNLQNWGFLCWKGRIFFGGFSYSVSLENGQGAIPQSGGLPRFKIHFDPHTFSTTIHARRLHLMNLNLVERYSEFRRLLWYYLQAVKCPGCEVVMD